jgi:hypothetical protein
VSNPGLQARGGNGDKWSGFDQLAISIIDMVDFLDDRGWQLLAIERLQLLHARDQMIAVYHRKPSFRRP